MQGSSQQGFALSLGLHLSVVAVVAVLAWTKPFAHKREQVFELIPLGTPGPAGQSPESGDVDFDLPDAPESRPTPPRQPPPQQRPPPPTPLRPAPPTPRPQTTPPPTVTRTPPAPITAPAPKVSYEDFVQQHGKPQTRTPPRTTTTPRPRSGPRIDTRFSPNISAVGGTPGRADGDPNAGEVASYIFRLAEAVNAVWIVSLDLEVLVDVDIAPNGRITVVRVSKSSGNAAFDESALEALRKVGSIGPTPRGERISRTLRFRPE